MSSNSTIAPAYLITDPHDGKSYEILERLGEGTFSVVYRAKCTVAAASGSSNRRKSRKRDMNEMNSRVNIYKDHTKSTVVALKCIHPNSSPKRILNELRFLKTLGGKNCCLPLLGGFRENCGFIAILPYFEHDDFKWYLPRLSTDLLRVYLHGLFRALEHVHSHGIIHRDVKPRNYLFSISRRKGLLIDFGLAQGPEEWQTFLGDDYEWDGSKIIRKTTSSGSIRNSDECQADVNMSGAENVDPSRPKKRGRVRRANNVKPSNGFKREQSTKKVRAERAGTHGFRAPEVLFMSLEQTPSIDIWSVGIVMLSLLSSRYPIFPKPETSQISSDAQAIAQIEALLGRQALERAAAACKKHLVETPGDKANLAKPPSMQALCTQGRQAFYDAVLKGEGVAPLDIFPDSVYDLLERCLEVVPNKRITAEEALNHPFFKDNVVV